METFCADAMRGGRVKALPHELLQRHPLALVIDLPAPRADPHEFFQITDAFQNPARRSAHQKPDRQDKQYFHRGPAIQKREWMLGEDEHRQFEQFIQVTDRHDPQKTEILIEDNPRQLRILFHASKDDSRKVSRAPNTPAARRRNKSSHLMCQKNLCHKFLQRALKPHRTLCKRQSLRAYRI